MLDLEVWFGPKVVQASGDWASVAELCKEQGYSRSFIVPRLRELIDMELWETRMMLPRKGLQRPVPHYRAVPGKKPNKGRSSK